jgi:predicted metal-dependent hydrolase
MEFTYKVVKHPRAKRVKIKVEYSGLVTVVLPRFVPIKMADFWVKRNHDWIVDRLRAIQVKKPKASLSKAQVTDLRLKARNLIRERLDHFNLYYKYKFLRITIRDQKTRWGSCSSNGTLSFNMKLGLVPIELLDYVVVHELCHLKEMNHSSKFWDLVAKTIPDYRMRRRQLKRMEMELV